jgi:hypothetical protein
MEFVFVGSAVLCVAYLFAYPRWRRWEIERDRQRNPHKVPVGGLVAPFDVIFHPTAYEANLIWDAETILPAPAPNADGTRPDLDSGRITINVAPSKHGSLDR